MISQVFQRPSQCASIGSLSLVAPTAILIKSLPSVLFCLLGACAGLWVAVFFLFVFFSLLYRLKMRGTLGPYSLQYHQLRASACYVGKEGGGLCIVCTKKKCGYVYQPPVGPENPSISMSDKKKKGEREACTRRRSFFVIVPPSGDVPRLVCEHEGAA